MMTSFTRVIIVLSLTRNAMGVQTIPPNQVLAGLALFITLFIMSPVITSINHDAVQPYLHGKITQTVAIQDAQAPLKTWMLKQTRYVGAGALRRSQHRARSRRRRTTSA